MFHEVECRRVVDDCRVLGTATVLDMHQSTVSCGVNVQLLSEKRPKDHAVGTW